eukprot:s155_g36.t1
MTHTFIGYGISSTQTGDEMQLRISLGVVIVGGTSARTHLWEQKVHAERGVGIVQVLFQLLKVMDFAGKFMKPSMFHDFP